MRGAGLLALPWRTRSLTDELEEYERGDVTRTRLLAWCCAGWCASIALFRPLEGVLFGIALFACVFRLPATLRVYRAALREPVVLWFVLFIMVSTIATMCSTQCDAWSDALPKRLFMVPLLVLPVLHRWRLMLAGLAIGAFAAVVISFGRMCGRFIYESEVPIEITDGAAWVLTVGVVAGFAALASANIRVRCIGVMLGLSTLGMQASMTQRAPVVGSIVALIVLLLMLWREFTGRTRLMIVVIVPIVAVIGFVISASVGGAVAKSLHQRETTKSQAFDTYDTLNYLSSSRIELWRHTIAGIQDRPIFGHGRLAWRDDIEARIAQTPTPTIAMQSILDDTRVNYSHNSELDVLYTSGVVGLSCLVIVGIIGIRTALRRLRGEPLAAVSIAALAGTLAASQFDFVFARAIPGALLIVLGLIVLLPRPSSSEWSRRGLGREDEWLDSWMR